MEKTGHAPMGREIICRRSAILGQTLVGDIDDTLSVIPVPFNDVSDGVFGDTEIACNPSV